MYMRIANAAMHAQKSHLQFNRILTTIYLYRKIVESSLYKIKLVLLSICCTKYFYVSLYICK